MLIALPYYDPPLSGAAPFSGDVWFDSKGLGLGHSLIVAACQQSVRGLIMMMAAANSLPTHLLARCDCYVACLL